MEKDLTEFNKSQMKMVNENADKHEKEFLETYEKEEEVRQEAYKKNIKPQCDYSDSD